jgi:tetratricopeptide (TPR) repeat protein
MYRAWGLLARGRLDQALSQLHRVPLGIRAIINMVSLETPALPAFVRLDPAIQDTIEHATPPSTSPSPLERLVPLYLRAMTHAARGRDAQARTSFDTVRVFFELGARARPDDAVLRGGLAFTYARLGRFDEAKRAVERAAQILPVSSDAFLGPGVALGQAQIMAMAGDQDAAIDKLAYLLTIPAPVTRELLRVDPIWDPLRGNPRFQRLVAGP